MPSSVYFNGILRYAAGGITKINADALNPSTPSTNGNIFLIGEADGGAPGVIAYGDDPSTIKDLFLSGPLVDGANLVFAPSNDPLIPGGATRVYVYKTNASTQASAYLPSAPASQVISSTVTSGSGTTLVDSAQITGSIDDQYNNMWIVLRPLTSTTEVKRVSDYSSSTGTFTVGSAWTSNPTAADVYLILTDTVNLIDKVAASSTTTVINTTATMVASEHVGRWAYVHRVGATPDLRRITANGTTSITVSPSLPAAPTASAYVEILANSIQVTSKNYGESQNGISVDLATSGYGKAVTVEFEGKQEIANAVGGVTFLNLLFRGASVSISDTVTGSASTTSVINLTTGGLTPSAHIGKQVSIDGEHTIITANTSTALTVSPPLSFVPTAGAVVQIKSISRATAKITGSAGKATTLTTSTGVVGADLSITFPAGQTVRQLAAQINLNTNYLAVIPNGVNGDIALVADFDYGAGTEKTILTSATVAATGFRQDTAQLVAYFNGFSQHVNATRIAGTYDGSAVPGDIADPIYLSGASRGISTNSSFQAGFDAAMTVRAHGVVPLIDQDLVNEGYGSTATVSSVAAQLLDHVVTARGVGASERGGFIGFTGTKAQIIAQANRLNDMDVALVCQNPTILNVSGSLQEFGPRMMAVMAAGCRAGVSEVGEPLTSKVIKVAGVTQDSSWSPNDLTDSNDLIKAGVLFTVQDENNVIRWARDLTTWVSDNNLAYSEGSIRDEIRYMAYNLRRGLESRFTGRKATPASLQSVRDAAVTILDQFKAANLIVDSTDLATGEKLNAYRNLRITSTGDVMKLSVCLTPCPGINFILNEISLALATQAV